MIGSEGGTRTLTAFQSTNFKSVRSQVTKGDEPILTGLAAVKVPLGLVSPCRATILARASFRFRNPTVTKAVEVGSDATIRRNRDECFAESGKPFLKRV